MDTNERIRRLMNDRGWTEYRLSKESGLSQSTISNIFTRNTVPSVQTLESVCGGFGITLAQFFCDGSLVELSEEQSQLFAKWVGLTKKQKLVIMELINIM